MNQESLTPLFRDTSAEAERVLVNLLRSAPAWRKLAMVGELNRSVRSLALAGLRERHPAASERELHRHLADILLGAELAERVYGLEVSAYAE